MAAVPLVATPGCAVPGGCRPIDASSIIHANLFAVTWSSRESRDPDGVRTVRDRQSIDSDNDDVDRRRKQVLLSASLISRITVEDLVARPVYCTPPHPYPPHPTPTVLYRALNGNANYAIIIIIFV